MVDELQQLHARILASLDALDALTAQPEPAMDRLPLARLALTRASRARTMLLERRYDEILAMAPPESRAAVRALRSQGKDQLVASVSHIGTWGLREIAARWPDYCAASAVIRAGMRERIRQEAAILYPMLAAPHGQAAAA